MTRYISGNHLNLKVGVSSYSKDLTSLEVVGRVGINSATAQNELDVAGSVNITDGLSVTGFSTFTDASFSGIVTSTGFVGNITGDLTGNADTSTQLETARNIGGVSFNGTADINLPGVNQIGNQDTSGNAGTATSLETARTISGTSFDGTSNITLNNNNITNGAGYITTSFTNTNQLTNGAGFITSSDNITGTAGGLSGAPNITVGNITATGNVSVAGTLTYEDVTSIDALGIGTFRTGVRVTSGGIVESAGGITGTHANISGIVTANTFRGDGSNLTGITASGVGAIGGLTVKNQSGTVVGTAGSIATLDFNGSSGVSVTATSGAAGIATINISPDGGNADQLDGEEGTYYLNYNNFSNTPTIPTNNNQLTNGQGFITSSDNITGTAAGLSGSPSITVTNITASGTVDGNLTGSVSTGDGYSNGVRIGAGDDLVIYETGSDVGINYGGTGTLFIRSSGDTKIDKNGSNRLLAHSDGAVDLYYAGSKKLETTNTGITVTGAIVKSGGTSSQFLKADGSVDSSTYITSADGGNADQLDGQDGTYYLNYNNFSNKPTIPTNNNQLTNGAGFITGVSTFSGSYNDLTNKPTIPTNNNQLTNGAGFITTSFTNTNQLTNGAGFITSSDNITGTAAGLSGSPSITVTNITASGTVDGRDISSDGSKLDGIASGAQVNVATDLGKTTTTTTNVITSSTGNNATINEATSSAAGLMSTTHHDKLDGIASGAQVNVATNLSYTASTRVLASSTGTNVTLPNVAAGGNSGLITGSDKTKLDGIATNATNVTNTNQLTNGAGFITSADGGNADQLDGQDGTYYLNYNNFSNTPTIPTNNNQLTNGAGFITTSFTNTNQLTNGAGFITSADGGNADQLDGQDGTYYLNYNNFSNTPTIPTNNNQLTNGENYITASSNISGTAAGLSGSPSITVTNITAVGDMSVAGTLTYEDVTSVDAVGLITARTGVRVTAGGIVVSNGGASITGNISVSGTVDGRDIASDGSKLDGIASGAQVNVATNLSKSTTTTTNVIASSTGNDVTLSEATGLAAGLMSSTHHNKLDGIASGAQVNVATNLSKSTTTTTNVIASSTGNDVTLSEATGSAAGLMSSTHHNKLDGIASGATNVTNTNQLTNGAGFITSADGGNADQLDGQDGTYYLNYNNFSNTPTIPTNNNQLTNGAGFITSANGGNADQLDGQDGTYYLNYNNFSNKPTIPTNNNQLTNGAGFITATLTTEEVQDICGGMVSGNTESGITVTYQDSDGTLDFSVASQTDNNFTTTLKNKLDGIANGAQVNVGTNLGVSRNSTSVTITSSTGNNTSISEATSTNSGVMTSSMHDKLDGIASGATNVTNNNQLTNGAGYVTSSGNTVIGTDSDIDTSGATIIDNLYMTDGVITSHGTRTLTLANLGYTGATNANYITNNNQLTNGSGYITSMSFNGLSSKTGGTGNYTTTGTFTAADFNSTSDIKLKENIEVVSGATEILNQLRGVKFTWKETEKQSVGVIAQEVEAVLPELVTPKEDEVKTVNYNGLVGVLIEAVKEQQKQINDLKNEIKSIKS